jgi:hypothetical protein
MYLSPLPGLKDLGNLLGPRASRPGLIHDAPAFSRQILAALAFLCLGSVGAFAAKGPEWSAKMSAAIPRIEKTLIVRNGMVAIHPRRAASLTDSEAALAKTLVDNVNGRIRRGALKSDENLKVITKEPGESLSRKDVGCDTHSITPGWAFPGSPASDLNRSRLWSTRSRALPRSTATTRSPLGRSRCR